MDSCSGIKSSNVTTDTTRRSRSTKGRCLIECSCKILSSEAGSVVSGVRFNKFKAQEFDEVITEAEDDYPLLARRL